MPSPITSEAEIASQRLAMVQSLNTKTKTLSRSDFNVFSRTVRGFTNNWHHDEWGHILQGRVKQTDDHLVYLPPDVTHENNSIMLMAPRSHAKSSEITVSYPLWKIGGNPNIRIVIVTETASQSHSFLREITSELERNERFKEIYGDLKPEQPDTWTQSEIIVNRTATKLKDPTVSATSVGGTVLSKRADIIICDDILSKANTRTVEQREKVRDWFWTVLYPVLEPGGQIIIVGTAWNAEDLYAQLMTDPTFDVRAKYKAVTNFDTEDVMWPERWDYKELMIRKKRMGTRSFYQAYQNVVLSAEDAVFKYPWLRDAKKKGTDRRLIRSLSYERWDLGEMVLGCGMDLAISEKSSADESAIAVVGMLRDGRKIPLWLEKGKWSPAEQRRRIVEVNENFGGLPLILVENNGYQEAFRRDTAEQADLNIRGYTTGGEKFDEFIGVNSMAVDFENGKWILPYDVSDGYTKKQIDDLVDGLLAFPSGHTADIVMSLWFAVTAIRDLTVGAASGGMEISNEGIFKWRG